MINIDDFVGALNGYQETRRKLDLCRQTATGDVEYCCSDFRERFQNASQELTNALNGFLDERVATEIARLTTVAPQSLVAALCTHC